MNLFKGALKYHSLSNDICYQTILSKIEFVEK